MTIAFCTWKAILLASGIPSDSSTQPARFLLSKHDDYGFAVLLRTTISARTLGWGEITSCVTGKTIFTWAQRMEGYEAIEIVYPSQLSKEEVAKLSARGKPLEVVEYEVIEHENIEHEVETETEN